MSMLSFSLCGWKVSGMLMSMPEVFLLCGWKASVLLMSIFELFCVYGRLVDCCIQEADGLCAHAAQSGIG